MALTWHEPVLDEWIDYNGHLSEPYYVLVFGNATTAFMDAVGMGEDYRAASGASFYTVEAHVRYLDEVSAGADLEVRTTVIGAKAKLAWLWHELWVDGRLRATEEIIGLHVGEDGSAPFPTDVAAAIAELRVDPPAEAGRRLSL